MTPTSSPGRLRVPTLALLSAALLAVASGCQDGGPTGPTSGSLVVQVIGLPTGTSAAVTLTGPGGYSRTIARTDTVPELAPGTYVLRTEALHALGALWVPPADSQQVTVAASRSPQLVAVAYELATGAVHVGVRGLPAGVTATLTLAGPGGYTRVVAAGDTIRELRPGDYSLVAASVPTARARYAAAAASPVPVRPALDPVEIEASYAIATAAIAVRASGLPAGTPVQVTVTRPGSPTTLLSAGDTLWQLEPDTYTVSYNSAYANDQTYAPDSAQVRVDARASETPAIATVAYSVATGTIELAAAGLPTGAKPVFTITAPSGASGQYTVGRLTNQVPGDYLVTASAYTAAGITYDPVTATSTAKVARGTVAQVTTTYTPRASAPPGTSPPPPSGAFNLTIDGMYVTQAVQNYQGTVPLVAGRDALVRVFVKATAANNTTPAVRVRVLNGAATVASYTITAPMAQAPLTVDQGTLDGSWNAVIPAALVQPGLAVVAEVDPGNTVPEANEGDNVFPAGGTPAALTVRAVPPVDMTFVPVLVSASGLLGTVNDIPTLMQSVLAVHPIAGYTSVVHPTFTTAAPALDAGDASGGWLRILSEIQALRIADGSSRMYYGLVKVPYSSGIAGYGYVGYPAAIGWDYLPSGAAVLAHEIGHNFGRSHSPCGNPAGPDRSYPYPDGSIGVYGWSARRNVAILPSSTDIMGYCGNQWISEYTYRGVMDFRGYLAGSGSPSVFGAGQASGMVMGTTPEPALVVWGRVHGRAITLEPSFQVTTRAAVPRSGSAYTARGLDASGAELFSLRFDGEAVADAPNADRAFAFAVPLAAAEQARLAKVVVTGRDGSRAEAVMGEAVDAPAIRVTRSGGSRARLRWDAARSPMVVVRDPASGKVLSFARGGDATIAVPAGDVEVTFGNRRGPARKLRPE